MEQLPDRIIGRRRRLTFEQREVFDEIFDSGGGFVLNFTNATMYEWFDENFSLEIFQARYQIEGASKGKTLRGFVEVAEPRLVARVLQKLWKYRCRLNNQHLGSNREEYLTAWINQFISELKSLSSPTINDTVPALGHDTTLSQLRDSISNDIISEKHNLAIDRVHTYCVSRFRSFLTSRNKPFRSRAPPPTLVGAYTRELSGEGRPDGFRHIPRLLNRIFDALNVARNQHSLAHANDLLSSPEAKFLVDVTIASLAYVESVEESIASLINEPKDDIPF